jgi:hypothetical protein
MSAAQDPCASFILSGKSSADCENPRLADPRSDNPASSMAFIDVTVVNVALPFLNGTKRYCDWRQWVVESYSLFLAALLLVGGSSGDRYGRRRVFSSAL